MKVWIGSKRETFSCTDICRRGVWWLRDGETQGGPELNRPADATEGVAGEEKAKVEQPPQEQPPQEEEEEHPPPKDKAEKAPAGGTAEHGFEAGQVAELDPDNFPAATGTATTHGTLVMFYATWCGHCKKLHHAYAEVAEHFAERASDVLISRYDAPGNPDIARAEGVRSFPWIKYYPKGEGESMKYEGKRERDAIVEWVEQRIGATV